MCHRLILLSPYHDSKTLQCIFRIFFLLKSKREKNRLYYTWHTTWKNFLIRQKECWFYKKNVHISLKTKLGLRHYLYAYMYTELSSSNKRFLSFGCLRYWCMMHDWSLKLYKYFKKKCSPQLGRAIIEQAHLTRGNMLIKKKWLS